MFRISRALKYFTVFLCLAALASAVSLAAWKLGASNQPSNLPPFLSTALQSFSPTTVPTPLVLPNNPHIRGKITNIFIRSDGNPTIIVEGAIEADTRYDQAFVGLHEDSKVFFEENGEYLDGSLSDLKLGQTVEV